MGVTPEKSLCRAVGENMMALMDSEDTSDLTCTVRWLTLKTVSVIIGIAVSDTNKRKGHANLHSDTCGNGRIVHG